MKILENCPSGLEKDYKNLMHYSRMFLRKLQIDSTDSLNDVKIDLEDAKDELLCILSNFVTSFEISKKEESEDALMLKFKFEQDMGEVISSIRDKDVFQMEGEIHIDSLLKSARNLKIVFNLIVYQPIVRANENEKDFEKYKTHIFDLVSSNASILGFSEKSSKVGKQPNKQNPSMFNQIMNRLSHKKEEPEQENEGSEESEESENNGDEDDE